MNYIMVEFDRDGKQYLYQTPFTHERGDLVLVNTYGKLQVCRVMSSDYNRYRLSKYEGPLNTIVGVAYMLEDLEQPTTSPQPKSFLSWLTQL